MAIQNRSIILRSIHVCWRSDWFLRRILRVSKNSPVAIFILNAMEPHLICAGYGDIHHPLSGILICMPTTGLEEAAVRPMTRYIGRNLMDRRKRCRKGQSK
jgi:hypothetical protein